LAGFSAVPEWAHSCQSSGLAGVLPFAIHPPHYTVSSKRVAQRGVSPHLSWADWLALLILLHEKMVVAIAYRLFHQAKLGEARPLSDLLYLRVVMVTTFMRPFAVHEG